VQLNQEFLEHKEKLERLLKIISSYQGETELSGNLRERLEEIAAYVLRYTLVAAMGSLLPVPYRTLQMLSKQRSTVDSHPEYSNPTTTSARSRISSTR